MKKSRRIAVALLPLSGVHQQIARQMEWALRFSFRNMMGERLLVRDTKGSPSICEGIINRECERTDIFIGPATSAEVLFIHNSLSRNNITSIPIATTSPRIKRLKRNIVHLCPNDSFQARVIDELLSHYNIGASAIVSSDNLYGVGISRLIRKNQTSVIKYLDVSITNLGKLVHSRNIEGFVLALSLPELHEFALKISKTKLEKHIFAGTESCSEPLILRDRAISKLASRNRMLTVSPSAMFEKEKYSDFETSFQKTFNMATGFHTRSSFDAGIIAKQALSKRPKPSVEETRQAYRELAQSNDFHLGTNDLSKKSYDIFEVTSDNEKVSASLVKIATWQHKAGFKWL